MFVCTTYNPSLPSTRHWGGATSVVDTAVTSCKPLAQPFGPQVADFLSFNDQRPAKLSTRTSSESSTSPTGPSARTLPERLKGLLLRWSRQAPSRTLDPVTSWGAILNHRHDCFKAIEVGGLLNRACSAVVLAWRNAHFIILWYFSCVRLFVAFPDPKGTIPL